MSGFLCVRSLTQGIPVLFSEECSNHQRWSAKVHPRDIRFGSVTIHICSLVLFSVGVYQLLVQIETIPAQTYEVGTFVLLCNPWLRGESIIEEYVKSDYGLVYMGSCQNVQSRLQYDPGVLEACLALLQVMCLFLLKVNANDDLEILLGKWEHDYRDGVKPTAWTGSAKILQQWLSSKFKPVRYRQCLVFASVLCTVMRVLGIPSRKVVTFFNAAHDTDANTTIEEYYTTNGEKLASFLFFFFKKRWNFHVWVECWMRRSDLGPGFDGWQVVDPTPQERSRGIFRCSPCPVAAIRERCFSVKFDTPFLYASVDRDIRCLILHNGVEVGQKVDCGTAYMHQKRQLRCSKCLYLSLFKCSCCLFQKSEIGRLSFSFLSPRVGFLHPGEKIEKKVSIKATSHGTKLLVATLSHSNNYITVSKSYHKVSVRAPWL
uniref:Transglutaminase-like domain-containing protein n=1 Tax=Xiphophorus couchianus TaxID=32473 RepID=A0A3B5KIU3_9TELE